MLTFLDDTIRVILSTGVDLSGYNLKMKFRRPNGRYGLWDATIDPSDSTKMYYDTDIGDLDVAGEWLIQAHAYTGVILRLHGNWAPFKVMEPYGDTSSPPTTVAPTTAP